MYFISSDIEWLGKIIPTESPLCLHVHFVPSYDLPSTCNEEFKPKRTLLPSACIFIPINSRNALLNFYELWHFYIVRIYNIQSQIFSSICHLLPEEVFPSFLLPSFSLMIWILSPPALKHHSLSNPVCHLCLKFSISRHLLISVKKEKKPFLNPTSSSSSQISWKYILIS